MSGNLSDKAALFMDEARDPFFQFEAHEKQRRFLFSKKRTIGMIGANRSGKSEVAAFNVAAVARGEHPRIKLPRGGGVIWLVALSEKMLKNISWAKMRHYVPDRLIAEKTERPGIYHLKMKNGAQIFGMSCEAGAAKFQGEACDLISFDEEPPEDVYKECLARLVDRDGIMTFSMTPIKGSTWFYRQVYKSRSEDVEIIKVGMRDNPHMREENIVRLEERFREKGASDDEIRVRVDGDYVLWGGRGVFDTSKLEGLLGVRQQECIFRGVFADDGGWVAAPGGIISIWSAQTSGTRTSSGPTLRKASRAETRMLEETFPRRTFTA